jgi:dUTP pyrophosphatase
MAELIFAKTGRVKSPARAHKEDACVDFFLPDFPDFKETTIYPQEDLLVNAKLKAAIPFGHALVFFNKSGIASKLGLVIGACVVDCGYTGEIHIHLINSGNRPAVVSPGMKIAQAALVPIISGAPVTIPLDQYEKAFGSSERGIGGFGSTGV